MTLSGTGKNGCGLEIKGSDRIHNNAVNGQDQKLHFKMNRILPKDECFSNKIDIAAGFKKVDVPKSY